MSNYLIYILVVLLAAFGYRRLMFCMKFFQQENYYNKRFFRFAIRKLQLLDTHVLVPMAIAAVIKSVYPLFDWIMLLPIIATALQIYIEKDPTKGGIKPLNKTARVKRIFWTAFGLWIVALIISQNLWYFAAIVLLSPLFLIASNAILVPVETAINNRYINEAKAKLEKYKPVVIGITGSFGKTSEKNILQHILNSYSTSFATKRSINTIMGIVRVIREEMNQPYKFFVAEMGIGDRGQMPQLLKFINPDFGILTAVGAAHLENFKKVDSVAHEKFRLSQYVAKKGGVTLLSGINIDPKFIERYKGDKDIVFTGKEISNIKQTIDGISFTLDYEGQKYEILAPVYGVHQTQNIAMGFIMARMLGVSADNIILALKTLTQTEHRLELRKEGNLTILDDSFNSNVNGFLSAIETGAAIKGKNRLILITPGMVELGTLHAEQHIVAGKKAATDADIVIAVNPSRIKDFTDQIPQDKLVMAENLGVAREWLTKNAHEGDVVLYENDLPDVYIEKIRL